MYKFIYFRLKQQQLMKRQFLLIALVNLFYILCLLLFKHFSFIQCLVEKQNEYQF